MNTATGGQAGIKKQPHGGSFAAEKTIEKTIRIKKDDGIGRRERKSI